MKVGAFAAFAAWSIVAPSLAAADSFPERKTFEGAGYIIEYSSGDEAYAHALAAQLPLRIDATPAAPVPLSVKDLAARRAQVLELIGKQLALPPTTPTMGQTFDAFVTANAALQSLRTVAAPTHFALWRKPELGARLAAGQDVSGFKRSDDGGIEFTMSTSFQFNEGESPEKGMQRLKEDWAKAVWPLKIGEEGAGTPEAEVLARLAELREQLSELASFQSAELQRLAVMNVLHETVERALVDQYIRRPDRRWFCEGVANYVAFSTIEALTDTQTAKSYYDVDADVAKYSALRSKVDLEHWPVAEDPRAKEVPADVNQASYAFASKAIFDAFADKPGLLVEVLKDVRAVPLERRNMKSLGDAYRTHAASELRGSAGS